MEKDYRSIFEKLKARGGNCDYEWFQAYGDPDLRNHLMVVGRAVNDWCDFHIKETEFEDLYSPIVPLTSDGDIESFFRNDSHYNMKRSAFWRTARAVTCGLYDCRWDNFGKYLSYSNLYKVALPSKNPNNALIRLQQPECINILRKEIELWKPAFILFQTGWDWVDPFLIDFEKKDGLTCFGRDGLLDDCGVFPNGCRIAVIPHPQGKKENLLAGQVIAFCKNFDDLFTKISEVSGGLERKWLLNENSEELYFTSPLFWEGVRLPLLLQTDLNMQCFRIGIWSRDQKYAPLSSVLSQKLNREFRTNSAWSGGYTEVKFHDADNDDLGIVKLVKDLYCLFQTTDMHF